MCIYICKCDTALVKQIQDSNGNTWYTLKDVSCSFQVFTKSAGETQQLDGLCYGKTIYFSPYRNIQFMGFQSHGGYPKAPS